MSARGWLGLALVLLALSGLAAVLPQGRTTLEELAPHASRAPSISLDPDDLPTNFPTPTELPDLDISEEELQELLEQLRAAGLSGVLPVPPNQSMPSLQDPPEAASDREGGPDEVTCIVFYSRSLECHNRGAVFKDVQRTPNGQYLFEVDQSGLVQFTPSAAATGEVTSTGVLPLDVSPTGYTIIPSIAPNQHLVSMRIVSGNPATQVRLFRDVNDMVWANADRTATVFLEITWAFSLDYYSLTWPSGHSFSDIPSAMRPPITSDVATIGRQITSHVGVTDDGDYSQAIRILATYFQEFGEGDIPPREQYADDMLAIAYGENGCCRHRSQAFLVAAQSLGAPTRMVVNEAHAFVEVWFPSQGWRMIDLGGCGQYNVQQVVEDHESIPVDTDVADNYGDGEGPVDDTPAVPTTIDITQYPTEVRRGTPFDLAGTVSSINGNLPASIPITIYYNRTKETPGTSFCATSTNGQATWNARCELPPSAPATSLQLVAHLAAARIGDQRTAPAYSDPQISVLGTTNLTIEGSTRTAVGIDVAVSTVLTDDTGNPVPGAQILFNSLGRNTQSQTDWTGRTQFPIKFDQPGTYQLRARFPGNDYLEGDNATFSVTAIHLDVDATLDTAQLLDGTVRVTGSLHDELGPVPNSKILFTQQDASKEGTTNKDGRFDVRLEDLTIEPGAHIATVRLVDFGVTLDLPFNKTVPVLLTLNTPERADVSSPFWFEGTLGYEDDDVVKLTAPLNITFVGPITKSVEVMAADGDYIGSILLPVGNYTATARTPAAAGLAAAEATDQVRVGILRHVASHRPLVVAPGEVLTLTGTVLFDQEPLQGTEVTASMAEEKAEDTTGNDGRYETWLRVPDNLFVGTTKAQLEIPALDHRENIDIQIGKPTRFQVDASRVAFSFGEPITASVAYVDEAGATVPVPYNLTVDGQPIAGTTTEFALAGTWLARVSTIEAQSDGAGEFAGTSVNYRVLVLNPLVPALVLLVGGAILALYLVRRSRGGASQQVLDVPSAAAPPQAAPGELASAHLLEPKPVGPIPAVFDPTMDPILAFHNGFGPDAKVLLDGTPFPSQIATERVTVNITDVPLGVHRLEFLEGKKRTAQFPLNVSPYHPPVGQSGRSLVGRARGKPLAETDPIRLSLFIDAVAKLRVPYELASEFRSAYEEALYAGRDCTRAQFARYFDAYYQIEPMVREPQPGRTA